MPNAAVRAVVNCFGGIPQSQCLKKCRGQFFLRLSKFIIDNHTVFFWACTVWEFDRTVKLSIYNLNQQFVSCDFGFRRILRIAKSDR